MSEFDSEPIRGVPGALPKGERVLWQGEPRWGLLARRVFHLPTLTVYFAVLLAVRITSVVLSGGSAADVALAAGWLFCAAVVAMAIFYAYGYFIARTSVYTITNKRLVIRTGVAMPMSLNIPFSAVESAGLKVYDKTGTGEIVLTLLPGRHVAYFALWPHARPWRIKRPEPLMRAVPDAETVAALLSKALAQTGPAEETRQGEAHKGEASAETGDGSAKWQSQAPAAA
ncbi:photosynthetic complex putative assembly protein PuhB [Afifella sp. IM 167]|uniref:photosynthetic complex putative assembly protein PuhB n=1 Tax=Afifella sp. IM 167 TaxID=2033586 RepID=UPI001CCC8545|nr:hypothetical protein [Afifella sp. IM 167]